MCIFKDIINGNLFKFLLLVLILEEDGFHLLKRRQKLLIRSVMEIKYFVAIFHCFKLRQQKGIAVFNLREKLKYEL